jgi:DNA-binding PadR family transcriptional regulator
MHGYQLNEFIEHNLALCTDIKKPTAYYLLDKLAQDGYISVVEESAPQPGRPPRRVYSITPKGESYFFELLQNDLRSYEVRTLPGDIGIAFMDTLPREQAHALLSERRAKIQQRLEEISQVSGHTGTLQLVIEHQVHQLRAELGWLESVLDKLAPVEDSQLNH